jgi:NAD(P)H-dependent flavin oxidoreductase YrpB (nitropropane dioxygenase family)
MKWMRSSFVALLVVASAVTFMGALGGCESSLHKSSIAAGSIAASLHEASVLNHTNTVETPENRKLVADLIVEAAVANDSFIGVLSSAEKNGGKVDWTIAAATFSRLTAQIDQLNQQGLLHIKNADTQAQFETIISAIRVEIAVIQALIPPQATVSIPAQNRPPGNRPYAPLAAITLTATEIEELIALAIAAGSALVPKLLSLRGKSDAEILAAAAEDDAAAIAQAVADGADAPKT